MAANAAAIAGAETRALASLDGPRQWPVLGNLPQVRLGRMHLQLEAWADRYGPLYRANLGRRDVLVVGRADLAARILRERPDGWRRLGTMRSVIGDMGGHGVFSAEGDDWRRQRRIVMGAFDPRHLAAFYPSLVRVTERFRAKLDAAARSGDAIDLAPFLMRYTVDVTAGLAFGIDMNTIDKPGDALQAHLDQVFPMLVRRMVAPFPWWRSVRLPMDRRFERHVAAVHRAIEGFVADARARIDRDPSLRDHPTNLLEAMLVARDDDGARLTDAEIVGNVFTVLLAGEDTTANTLGWALHLLHRNRDAWDRLVRDVDGALGDDPLPRDFATARGLDAIERAMDEAMRLKPVAPFMLVQNNVDTVVGDVALPADTTVVLLMRRDCVATTGVPDAAAFEPDRWRDGPDDATRGLRRASMPFGAGPRLCPGRYLAMLEMKMVVATIARHFELVSVETDDGGEPGERFSFTMSAEGLRMRLASRLNSGQK